MHTELAAVLKTFTPITLAEMEGVELMDRTDTKYIFNISQLPGVLENLSQYYKLLNVNGVNENKYKTLYFDTPDFQLYMDHHNGRTNRYKVRYRQYVDSGLVFFEIKNKNNKERTIKSRIKRTNIADTIEGQSIGLGQIDQITLLFNPNSANSDTYYFDEITGPPLVSDKTTAASLAK